MTQTIEQAKTLPVNEQGALPRLGTSFAQDGATRLWIIGSLMAGMLAVAVAGILLYQQSMGASAASDAVIHNQVVITELENTSSIVRDAERGQRGLLLTGNESYLTPYNAATASIDARMQALSRLTADDPTQQAILKKVAPTVSKKFAELASTIKLYRTEGLGSAIRVVRNDNGENWMAEIISAFETMKAQERKQLEESNTLLQSRLRNVINTFTCLALLTIGLSVAFAYFSRRYLSAVNRLQRSLVERSQLREEQAELLQLTYDAIMVRDLTDGTIKYWNKGAQDLYGFTPDEAIGHKSHELLNTQFPTALEEIEKEAPAVGHWEGELIQTTKDGRKLTVASRWRFKADAEGHLSSIMETDISERKRNEEEILRAKLEKVEQQERSNEELLELTYDAIMVRNLTDGKIRYWNKGAQDLYGFTSEEAIGRMSTELLQTQFPTALEEIEKEAPAVGHWEGELIQTTKDGRKLTVASRWRFKADSEGHLSSIMETDITERKRNEEEILRAKLEKFEQQERSNEELLELTFDAIMVRNLTDGRIRYWNKGAQDLYGFTSAEAIGQMSHELLKTQFPTALEEIEKEAPAVGHWEGELVQTTKEGRKLTVASRWRFKADAEGHLSSILETDISERKRNEETILRAKEEKLLELERSNEELQEFAYVCSHDLQEPLRVISNFSQLLGVRYRGKLDEKGDQFIDFIVDGAKRMQNLINDLLVFSRVQTKGQVFGTIDCVDSVKMAQANLQLLIEETGARVTVGKLPQVKGDTTQLMQLFQNILANALKFRSKEKPPDIHISAEQIGDGWQFAISDNGVGLDMQFAERIFVIFQRLHTKEAYPGSGLGLAVCRKIVQRHGGRIWVQSKLGEGTTFYFTIPRLETAGERN